MKMKSSIKILKLYLFPCGNGYWLPWFENTKDEIIEGVDLND
jgi:hypothetical protein